MTREEAIKELQESLDTLREYDIAHSSRLKQALEMAIKALEQVTEVRKLILQAERSGIHLDYGAYLFMNALEKVVGEKQIGELEQEPCADAVSREDVLKEIIRFSTEEGASVECQQLYCDVNNMPPVTQKSGKWIPVSERLPEDKTYVLTTIKVPNRIAHARSSWYEGGFFHNDNGDTWRATDMEVKAWMPLPKPYEPQESEE